MHWCRVAPGMRITIVVGVAAALLLPSAASAQRSPVRDHRPLRIWSFSESTAAGLGFRKLDGGTQLGGRVNRRHDFGPALFDPRGPDGPPDGLATGRVFSTASGRSFGVSTQAPIGNVNDPRSPVGNRVDLHQWQSYEKVNPKGSLRFKITEAILHAIDANGMRLLPSECPSGKDARCLDVIEGELHFEASVYSADRYLFFSAGSVVLRGWMEIWRYDAYTSSEAQTPFWRRDDFEPGLNLISEASAELRKPRSFKVGLSSLDVGEEFALHVHVYATTHDGRGRESALEARIQDPQSASPVMVETSGLRRTNNPRLHEPRRTPVRPAKCRRGVSRAAGKLRFSAPGYAVGERAGASPKVLVTRVGGTRGDVSATVKTSNGSATSGSDYEKVRTTVRFADGDDAPRVVDIPIRSDDEAEEDETVNVKLSNPRCGGLGSPAETSLTIADDDRPVQPPPSFTIGGTVSGLQGSGLVLSNQGAQLPVGNGPFAFPLPVADRLPYDVRVATQPSNPEQVCTVARGAGTVGGADVTDVAVDCAPPATNSLLDLSFGGDGKVTTPVGGGEAEAVLLQPDGRIVTAGRSTALGNIDFTLMRHDSSGNLDAGFGQGGIAKLDLGSVTDEALDAALQPDGKIVAVGLTVGPAFNRNFGVVRLEADGDPDPGFDQDGVVTTDFAGAVDQANAVAVQPDGKIVVAGHAATTGPLGTDNDFALARYNPGGSLDASFGGGDGLVMTDLGSRTDLGRALALQPDGKIVVAGTSDDDVALVRYTAAGDPDGAFGNGGIVLTNGGFATGVALQSDGKIVVVGHRGGALTTDFALYRYTAGGGPDTAFGTLGLVTTDIGGGEDFGEDLAVQADDSIIVVGRASSTTLLDMAVARYHPDGGIDTGFGQNGIVTTDFHGSGDFGQDVRVQPDGKIVAAGYTANGANTEFALTRINP